MSFPRHISILIWIKKTKQLTGSMDLPTHTYTVVLHMDLISMQQQKNNEDEPQIEKLASVSFSNSYTVHTDYRSNTLRCCLLVIRGKVSHCDTWRTRQTREKRLKIRRKLKKTQQKNLTFPHGATNLVAPSRLSG